MTTYKAVFIREDDGKWSVTAPDIKGAHSWGRSLNAAHQHIREAIASVLELDDHDFETVEIDPIYHVGDPDLDELLINAKRTRQTLHAAQLNALEALEQAVAASQSKNLSMRDMAEMTDVTHSRIQQIEAELTSQ